MSDYTKADLDRMGGRWLARIQAAEKREEKWIKDAEVAEAAYLCDDHDFASVPQFNILHSNVETIVPAIYNSTPSPDIRPRHDVRDDAAKQFADALERAIATQIDDDRLSAEVEGMAQDGEVSGRGVIRVTFDVADDGVSSPSVGYECIAWRDYREGPAKRWSGVPWVAYRYSVSKKDADEMADEALTAHYEEPFADDEELDVDIWQIWCKETAKVYVLVEQKTRIISIIDDPLGLKGFFPQPEPVQPITGTGRRTPVCPYKVYSELANELDRATKRINGIMKGLKVRGIFASNGEVLERLAEAEDNELVAAEDIQGLIAQGGLDKAVMWWPVDVAIAVLRELYAQREQTKQAIYEITGISDIVRGASDPNETFGAQEIKAQWGSQRVKRRQRMIQSAIRDLFLISAEIITSKFTPEALAQAAGVEFTPEMAEFMGRLDHFRIDVESDSTIQDDLTRQRGEMAQFMTATSTFFKEVAPIVAQTPDAAPAMAEIYGSFARKFQLGKSAEDAIDQLLEQARQNAGETPEQQEAKAIQQAQAQIDLQRAQADVMEAQSRAAKAQSDAQAAMIRAQSEAMKAKADIAIKAQELGLKVNDQSLRELQAEVDAMFRLEEVEMERDQRRPVEFG